MGLLTGLRHQRKGTEATPAPREGLAPSFVLSQDSQAARHELFSLIFYLTTFGYIDGEFDPQETAFIRQTIDRVIEHRLRLTAEDKALSADELEVMAAEDRAFFHELFDAVQKEVTRLLNDSVAQAEAMHVYLGCKLKQRCFEIFKGFDAEQQRQLLATADELLRADGVLHPAELSLRQELAELLAADHAPPPLEPDQRVHPPRLRLDEQASRPLPALAPAAFTPFEHDYSEDPKVLRRQLDADRSLIKGALQVVEGLRKRGRNKLVGVSRVDELTPGDRFLDDFVHVQVPSPGRRYELTVLGDLHGCYSCLKAALLQSRFFRKVAAFREDPEGQPEPRLVLLGDYIDRGRFSLQGVLRLVLQLQRSAPEHVIMLRGNHEHLIDDKGTVRSIVAGADAIEELRGRAPIQLLKDYRRLFDNTPSALIFGRLLFTHAGIPSDGLVRACWRDLSTLNEPPVRFQMMWSDPSLVDVIPRSLQDQSLRFAFGRLQGQAFLHRIGCHTLIRGHGVVATGFRLDADDGVVIATLCSAGGPVNRDLPPVSELRLVRPMAMTIHLEGGRDEELAVDVWPIDYQRFNDPEHNGFYRDEDEEEATAEEE